MYRICICDDDIYILEHLYKMLLSYSFQRNVDFQIIKYCSANDLLTIDASFDIIFLDIQFHSQKDGIDIAKQLRTLGNSSLIVFITSFADMSIKGYEAEAFRFVVKPLHEAKIFTVMDSCFGKLQRNKILEIKTLDGFEFVRTQEIQFISSFARKRILYLDGEKQKSTWQTLKELYAVLPNTQFQYAQKSFIVNLDKITSISNNIITMKNGETISLSRNNKDVFFAALQRFIGES